MDSKNTSTVSADLNAPKPISHGADSGVSSGDLKKRSHHDGGSTAVPTNSSVNTGASSASAASGEAATKKRHGKAVVTADIADDLMFFSDVELGPQEGELRFRLINFWEARNPYTKSLIGLEMLLIDEQGTVIQGFIPPGRIGTYLPHMVAGSTYRLNKFYGSKSKDVYRVAEPVVTVTFTWNSALSVLADGSARYPEDHFRIHGPDEFAAACDRKGDLYDYIGHMRLINEQAVSDGVVLDEAEIASTQRIGLHVQTQGGPLIKINLWDKVATDFYKKFKAHGHTPSVVLVTTVNPKRFGGALTLSSFPSSRVFFDNDVQPTREYLIWLRANPDVANMVNANVLTKPEPVTIAELFSYAKETGATVAWFECTATIDDFVRDAAWYYVACGECKTKATKGPTTLMCKKCGKAEVAGVAMYLSRISVYDKTDLAKFVVIAEAGFELTGRRASELVASYYEANEREGEDHVVPLPQSLIDTIGQTRKFIVKVSTHNLTGKTQTFTVTKVLPLEAPIPEGNLEENA